MASNCSLRNTTRTYIALYKRKEMRLVFNPSNKESTQRLDEQLGMLEEGTYLVTVIPIDGKTIRGLQNKYFLMVDTICSHAGEDKTMMHENFKEHLKVESTKNFDLEDWYKFIAAFRDKMFADYNVLL